MARATHKHAEHYAASPGIRARDPQEAAAKWAKAYEPFARALRKLKLPPRGPRRSLQNYERSVLVSAQMHQLALILREKKKRKR